jgi:signal transduction histidine kinase
MRRMPLMPLTARRVWGWRIGRRGYWPRILTANVIAALMIVVVFSGATLSTPLRDLARAFGIAFVFAMCTGPLLGLVMPWIAPRVWARLGFPFNWIAVAAVMAALAVVGTILGILVLIALRVVAPQHFFVWLRGSMRIAIVVSLTIGLFITGYEVMRARVAHATAQAQLASLEARVQPHFLFNTLNSIAELIREDPVGAERMTGQLASLLRSSLDQQSAPLVSLDDELKIVRDYLAIERVRFGDRLRYRIDIADGLGMTMVPRLAMQTLVENSVKFAVAPRREGASIAVRAARSGDAVIIDVEDDGPGFDPSQLPAGHGLALLRDRLALTIGRGSFQIDGTPGRTVVSIRTPSKDKLHDVPSPIRIAREDCS